MIMMKMIEVCISILLLEYDDMYESSEQSSSRDLEDAATVETSSLM